MIDSNFSLLLSLGTLLWTSRILGLISKRLGQPAILGELTAGVLLGPTILGRFFPELFLVLFPKTGTVPEFYAGFNTLAVLLLLFSGGFEMNLSSIYKNKGSALIVSGFGIVFPFLLGAIATWKYPIAFGYDSSSTHEVFSLFMATAMSISALPVITKTLRDLKIYDSRVGSITISAAILDDLAGWIIFSVVLVLASHSAPSLTEGAKALVLSLLFAVLMLTIGSAVFHRILPWIKGWSNKILSYCLGIALFSGALTDWVGVHSPFGAFVAGASMGNTKYLDEDTKGIVTDFVDSFFAPVFFATLGLKADFISDFQWKTVLSVLLIACLGKILGCGMAALLAGLSRTESICIGLAMNSRGAMELLLGSIALTHGIIGRSVFVALAIMAMITSLMAGVLIPSRRLLAESLTGLRT